MSKSYSIIIVGAGLAGLSAAIALARAGHKVTILEKRADLSGIGGGIQIPANASRIILSWDLGEKFEAISSSPRGIHIKRYKDGKLLYTTRTEQQPGQPPNWTVYRPDYQRILFDAAVELGVVVEFDRAVTDPSGLEADLVILADGIGSHTRSFITGMQSTAELVPASRNVYRALIPQDDISSDPRTAELADGYQHLWTGPGRYIMAYPIANGRYFNMSLIHPGATEPGDWNRTCPTEQVILEFSDFEPGVHRLLEKVESCVDWTLGMLKPLETWTADNGRILLVGDAAHAMTPDFAQGAAMCVEDAAVLAICLSRANDILDATQAFVKLRKERTEKIQQASWANGRTFTMPDGPAQEHRDNAFSHEIASDDFLAQLRAYIYGTDVVKEASDHFDKAQKS